MSGGVLRRAGIAVFAGAVLLVPGCSMSLSSGGSVKQDVLQREVAKQIALDPEHVPEVTCDGDLEGKVGATQSCLVKAGGESLPYTATVTSVQGDNVNFHVKADSAG